MGEKNKSKRIANWSLGVMGAGFLATLPIDHSIAGKVMQGGFEAGLVGGLADWFAVTALFRHPMNIPIPHTALLPKNRERVTKAILHTVQNEWLTKDSIVSKVKNIPIADTIMQKVEEQLEKPETVSHIKKLALYAVDEINTSQYEEQIEVWAKQMLHDFDERPLLREGIDKVLEHKVEEKVYAFLLQTVSKKVTEEETKEKITKMILDAIEKKSNNKLYGIAIKPLMNMIGEKKLKEIVDSAIVEMIDNLNDENSENRQNILAYLRKQMTDIKENEAVFTKLHTMKEEWVASYDIKPHIQSILSKAKENIVKKVEDEAWLTAHVLPKIKSAVTRIKENQETMNKMDDWIKAQLVSIVEKNHEKIGQLVQDNIDKLSTDEITAMLEDKLGKDISWIRVNGALCGCLIGLGLTAIKIFAG